MWYNVHLLQDSLGCMLNCTGFQLDNILRPDNRAVQLPGMPLQHIQSLGVRLVSNDHRPPGLHDARLRLRYASEAAACNDKLNEGPQQQLSALIEWRAQQAGVRLVNSMTVCTFAGRNMP